MKVVDTIREVREEIAKARKEGKKVGFVPTMGFLHEGHLSLVEESKKHSNFQVMSIFVNRIQFNDPKDFDNYPIDLESDYALAEKAGVDLIFVPV
jgi:pantoate--beta-alanine ligase